MRNFEVSGATAMTKKELWKEFITKNNVDDCEYEGE